MCPMCASGARQDATTRAELEAFARDVMVGFGGESERRWLEQLSLAACGSTETGSKSADGITAFDLSSALSSRPRIT